MAYDKVVDSATLDADLTSVADAIRTKGNTNADLAFPGGYVDAIQDIPTGVNVQKKTGSFTTSTSGAATVNVGFQPDFVAFNAGTSPTGGTSYPGFPFKESGKTTVEVLHAAQSSSYLFGATICTRSSTGFSIQMLNTSASMSTSPASRRTCQYVAVKYS